MVLLVSVWDSAGRGAVRGSVLQFLVLEPGLLHREEGMDQSQSPIVSTNHNPALKVVLVWNMVMYVGQYLKDIVQWDRPQVLTNQAQHVKILTNSRSLLWSNYRPSGPRSMACRLHTPC